MINLILFTFLLALAVWQIIEVLHHSVIASPYRSVAKRIPGWFKACGFDSLSQYIAAGILCPFCQSVRISLYIAFLYLLPSTFHQFIEFILVAAASSRLANYMSDYTTSFGISRTPNDNEEAARMISLPPVDGEVPIIYPAENDSPLSDKTGVDK